jgi:hypothetical protein
MSAGKQKKLTVIETLTKQIKAAEYAFNVAKNIGLETVVTVPLGTKEGDKFTHNNYEFTCPKLSETRHCRIIIPHALMQNEEKEENQKKMKEIGEHIDFLKKQKKELVEKGKAKKDGGRKTRRKKRKRKRTKKKHKRKTKRKRK